MLALKKVLVVAVAEVTEEGEWSYERGKFGATAYELQLWPNGSNSGECRKW